MKPCLMPLFFILYFVLVAALFGQKLTGENPAVCKTGNPSKGSYKVLSVSNGLELQFYLEISPQYRNDKNYRTIAKEFKGKYCQASQLRVIYLKSKAQWLIKEPQDIKGTPLAIFYMDRNRKDEGLLLYEVTNGKVETRKLEIDQP